MQDPNDLDTFSPDQIEWTRKQDSEGAQVTEELLQMAKQRLMATLAVMASLPLNQWQRACYEAHAVLRSERIAGGDKEELLARELFARDLWHYLRYVQQFIADTDDAEARFLELTGRSKP